MERLHDSVIDDDAFGGFRVAGQLPRGWNGFRELRPTAVNQEAASYRPGPEEVHREANRLQERDSRLLEQQGITYDGSLWDE